MSWCGHDISGDINIVLNEPYTIRHISDQIISPAGDPGNRYMYLQLWHTNDQLNVNMKHSQLSIFR